MTPSFSTSSARFTCTPIQFLLSFPMLLFTLLLISQYCVCVLISCCLVYLLYTFSFAHFLLSVSFHVSSEMHSFFWLSLKPRIFSLVSVYTFFLPFQLSSMSVFSFWLDSTENLFFSSNLNSSLTLHIWSFCTLYVFLLVSIFFLASNILNLKFAIMRWWSLPISDGGHCLYQLVVTVYISWWSLPISDGGHCLYQLLFCFSHLI